MTLPQKVSFFWENTNVPLHTHRVGARCNRVQSPPCLDCPAPAAALPPAAAAAFIALPFSLLHCTAGCVLSTSTALPAACPGYFSVAQNASSPPLTDAPDCPQNTISWPPAQLFHPR